MDLSPPLPRADLRLAAAAFRTRLAGAHDDPVEPALHAIAHGWSAKWT